MTVDMGVTYNLMIVKTGRHEVDITVNISSVTRDAAAMEGKLDLSVVYVIPGTISQPWTAKINGIAGRGEGQRGRGRYRGGGQGGGRDQGEREGRVKGGRKHGKTHETLGWKL